MITTCVVVLGQWGRPAMSSRAMCGRAWTTSPASSLLFTICRLWKSDWQLLTGYVLDEGRRLNRHRQHTHYGRAGRTSQTCWTGCQIEKDVISSLVFIFSPTLLLIHPADSWYSIHSVVFITLITTTCPSQLTPKQKCFQQLLKLFAANVPTQGWCRAFHMIRRRPATRSSCHRSCCACIEQHTLEQTATTVRDEADISTRYAGAWPDNDCCPRHETLYSTVAAQEASTTGAAWVWNGRTS